MSTKEGGTSGPAGFSRDSPPCAAHNTDAALHGAQREGWCPACTKVCHNLSQRAPLCAKIHWGHRGGARGCDDFDGAPWAPHPLGAWRACTAGGCLGQGARGVHARRASAATLAWQLRARVGRPEPTRAGLGDWGRGEGAQASMWSSPGTSSVACGGGSVVCWARFDSMARRVSAVAGSCRVRSWWLLL